MGINGCGRQRLHPPQGLPRPVPPPSPQAPSPLPPGSRSRWHRPLRIDLTELTIGEFRTFARATSLHWRGDDALTAGGSWWYGPEQARADDTQWKAANFTRSTSGSAAPTTRRAEANRAVTRHIRLTCREQSRSDGRSAQR